VYTYSMKNDIKKLQKESDKLGETNDCAVTAVAAVSNLPYEYVHRVFASCGRKRRKGTPFEVTQEVLKKLNIWTDRHRFEAQTITTMGRELPKKGRFLVRIRRHILAVVDGEVLDWTEGRRHRIRQAYKVSF